MNDQLVATPALRSVSSPATPSLAANGRRWIGGHRRWLAIVGVVVLVLAVAAGAAWWKIGGTATTHYVTAPATRGAVVRTVTATGTVNPELTIIVGSYVSGVIQSLSCDYNTKVKAGQVCAAIDPRPYQSVVDQAKANLAVAKAQLVKAKANLVYTKVNSERRAWLVTKESESKDVADLAKDMYDQATAEVGDRRPARAQSPTGASMPDGRSPTRTTMRRLLSSLSGKPSITSSSGRTRARSAPTSRSGACRCR